VISIDEGETILRHPLVEKNVGVKSYSGELRVYLNHNLRAMFMDFKPGNPYFTSTIRYLRKFSTLPGINLYLLHVLSGLRNPTDVCLSNDNFQLIIGTHYRQKKFLITNLKPVIRLTRETDMPVELLKSPRGYVRLRNHITGFLRQSYHLNLGSNQTSKNPCKNLSGGNKRTIRSYICLNPLRIVGTALEREKF